MTSSGHIKTSSKPAGVCLARSVADSLAHEPCLEAVTIDAGREKISLATLGRANLPEISARLQHRFSLAQSGEEAHDCALFTGKGNCSVCDHPLSRAELNSITIEQKGLVTTIARVTCPTAPKFWRWNEIPFPKIAPRQVDLPDEEHPENEWKWQLLAAALCGLFALGAFFSLGSLRVTLFVLAYIAGGSFPAVEVWERLQSRVLDVHFLMLAVAAGAASIGAWTEGATLLFLFSLSGGLEHYALGRTQKEIRSLFRDAPKTATVLDSSGTPSEVPVENLQRGMRLLIKPGSQFPVDGEIISGETASDESNLTGEAVPVVKSVGDKTFAGTLNLWGAVEVMVTHPAAESALQKIIVLIREAQKQKAPSQRFTDRFSTGYTYGVLALSLAMFLAWWLILRIPPFHAATGHSAFYLAMTLLVVSSPCALVLSIPSAILAAIAHGARHGILFRGGAAVEKLASVQVVALDKTGTLTTGELKVESVQSIPPGRESEILQIACSLEALSNHPLARAISRHGRQQNVQSMSLSKFESVTGQGLRAFVGQTEYRLGRKDWVFQANAPDLGGDSSSGSLTEVWVSGQGLAGRIVLRDDLRPQARDVINQLRANRLVTMVLTGDRESVAEQLRSSLAVDEIKAGLSPEAKVQIIQGLVSSGRRVAMIGDGVNDAPSLAAADIGVAMGARGSDAALEQSDVVLMHDRLENFLAAFRLSQRAGAIIRQNLFVSLGTIIVLVACAIAGRIPLTLGVVGHEGSTVIVVMNSLRLLMQPNASNAVEKPKVAPVKTT